MEDYNFWADLLATYRASPDLIKALWLLVPLAPAALGIGAALRLMEPRQRVPEHAAPEKERRAEIALHTAVSGVPLIEMEADKQPVSRRLPYR